METLEHFAVIFPVSLRRSVYSGSLRGRLHRYAMETCSARIDPHNVFALAPVANRLKNALGHAYTITLSSAQSRRFARAAMDGVCPGRISQSTGLRKHRLRLQRQTARSAGKSRTRAAREPTGWRINRKTIKSGT